MKRVTSNAASRMSRRYFLALRRIKERPSFLNRLHKIGVPEWLVNDEIDGAVEQSGKGPFQFEESAEPRIRVGIGPKGNDEVKITGPGIELASSSGTKQFEPLHLITTAKVNEFISVLLNQGNHGTRSGSKANPNESRLANLALPMARF